MAAEILQLFYRKVNNVIKIVSFYKDIVLEQEKAKKLKQRMSFDYNNTLIKRNN